MEKVFCITMQPLQRLQPLQPFSKRLIKEYKELVNILPPNAKVDCNYNNPIFTFSLTFPSGNVQFIIDCSIRYPFKVPNCRIVNNCINPCLTPFEARNLSHRIDKLPIIKKWTPQNQLVEISKQCVAIITEFVNLRTTIQNSIPPKELTVDKFIELLTAQEIHKITENIYLGGAHDVKKLAGSNDVVFDNIMHVTKTKLLWTHDCESIFNFVEENSDSDVSCDTFQQNNYKSLIDAIHFIDICLITNTSVFIHCQQGIDRSTTVIMAFLMFYYGATVEQSLNYIRSIRYIAEPMNVYINMLNSQSFQDIINKDRRM